MKRISEKNITHRTKRAKSLREAAQIASKSGYYYFKWRGSVYGTAQIDL